MKKICVVDYDAGNTMSVMNALQYIGVDAELTNDAKVLRAADNVIFPGVGAYYDSMQKVAEYGLRPTLDDLVKNKTPFLGICLGMQLLFERSYETIGSASEEPTVGGLNFLPGEIVSFKAKNDFSEKVPHMGWNSIDIKNTDSRLFAGIGNDAYVYFVHSFYLTAKEKSDVAAECTYGGVTFDAAVEHGNLFGCQFHPEKSGEVGLEILKNFCRL